jgi:hypothetical protein
MSKILSHRGLSDAWSFKFGHVLKVGAAKCLKQKWNRHLMRWWVFVGFYGSIKILLVSNLLASPRLFWISDILSLAAKEVAAGEPEKESYISFSISAVFSWWGKGTSLVQQIVYFYLFSWIFCFYKKLLK